MPRPFVGGVHVSIAKDWPTPCCVPWSVERWARPARDATPFPVDGVSGTGVHRFRCEQPALGRTFGGICCSSSCSAWTPFGQFAGWMGSGDPLAVVVSGRVDQVVVQGRGVHRSLLVGRRCWLDGLPGEGLEVIRNTSRPMGGVTGRTSVRASSVGCNSQRWYPPL